MQNEHLPEIGSTITIQKPAFNSILARLKEYGYLPIENDFYMLVLRDNKGKKNES